jgi:hypothetical protein
MFLPKILRRVTKKMAATRLFPSTDSPDFTDRERRRFQTEGNSEGFRKLANETKVLVCPS